MRSKVSLKTILIASFVMLAVVMMAAYSVLTKEYFIRGLDASLAVSMEKTVVTFEEHVREEKQKLPQEFSGFNISTDWDCMPDYIKAAFKIPPIRHAVLYKKIDEPFFGRPDEILFLMRYDYKGKPYYISYKITPGVRMTTLHVTKQENQKLMLIISLVMITTIFLIGWLVLKHVSKPMIALRSWINSLDSKKIAGPTPDFTYPELNDLAELMKQSLSSVQAALDREHRFLRYASHELRTPISTIRSNIGLYRKLAEKNQHPEQEIAVLDRIDRASMTMKHLTETLLWMSHETDAPIQCSDTDIGGLIEDISEEMKYLLNGKNVSVSLDLHSHVQNVPSVPARIIIGNLIRNAYQHSWDGEVLIRYKSGELVISNKMIETEEEASQNDQTGYGLGLELTGQLVKRIGWKTEQQIENGRFIAILKML